MQFPVKASKAIDKGIYQQIDKDWKQYTPALTAQISEIYIAYPGFIRYIRKIQGVRQVGKKVE